MQLAREIVLLYMLVWSLMLFVATFCSRGTPKSKFVFSILQDGPLEPLTQTTKLDNRLHRYFGRQCILQSVSRPGERTDPHLVWIVPQLSHFLPPFLSLCHNIPKRRAAGANPNLIHSPRMGALMLFQTLQRSGVSHSLAVAGQ